MPQGDVSYIFIDSRKKEIEVQVSCSFRKRGKWHFAECQELQLIDQGLSKRQALDNLAEMIVLALVSAVENGKIGDMLKALGFRKLEPVPDKTFFKQTLEMDGRIPIPAFTIPLENPMEGRALACSI